MTVNRTHCSHSHYALNCTKSRITIHRLPLWKCPWTRPVSINENLYDEARHIFKTDKHGICATRHGRACRHVKLIPVLFQVLVVSNCIVISWLRSNRSTPHHKWQTSRSVIRSQWLRSTWVKFSLGHWSSSVKSVILILW